MTTQAAGQVENATDPTEGAVVRDEAFRVKRRRAILSAWAGFAVDSYSIYIVTSTLVPALGYFQGDMSAEQKSIVAGMTLAVTLLGRPLGGIIFGHFADLLGRQRIGSITIFGFGAISLLIACLPGAETVGPVAATSLLIALRFIEGIFLGGEYTAATPMAMEYAPNGRRGLVGALVQCAASVGPLMVAIVNLLVLAVAPSGGLHSPYVQWGWRIPFAMGFVVALVVAMFLRRSVEDSDVWRVAAGKRTASPLRALFRGEAGRAFLQSWTFMTGLFFLGTMGTSVMIQFLLGNQGYTPADLAHTQLVTPPVAISSYLFYGWLSDRVGRKPALYASGAAAMLLAPITITIIGLGLVRGWAGLTVLAALTQFFFLGPNGVIASYINERFATAVRSSGWGVAYSTAVIVPAFFPYYMVWLGRFMPFVYTAGALMALGGALVIVAAACGPETRGVDLRTVGSRRSQAPSRG